MRKIIALALCVLFCGCQAMWDMSNRGELQKGAAEIIARYDYSPAPLECHMIGMTRLGYCRTQLSGLERKEMIKGLQLEPAIEYGDALHQHESMDMKVIYRKDTAGCSGKPEFSDTAQLEVYKTIDGNDRMDLRKGRFESMTFYHKFDTDEVCFEVNYPYG